MAADSSYSSRVPNTVQVETWTVKGILDWCQGYLARCGDESPRVSAEWLLSEALGMSRIDLYLNYAKPLSPTERQVMRDWVRRRGKGEPLQLICGHAPFRYLTLKVAPGVLIPRPETEVLVSEAMKELSLPRPSAHVLDDEEGQEQTVEAELPQVMVADVCTGSGCIACSIASEYPSAHVVAIDVAPKALTLAQDNVDMLGLTDRVEVLENDLLSGLSDTYADSFDLVISNPPYVPSEVCDSLSSEVLDYDPLLALDGGEDGLDLVRRMLPDCYRVAKPGGVVAMELFEGHMKEATDLFAANGFVSCRVVSDLAGKPRVIIARKPA